MERHAEQPAQAVVQRSGIGNQEDEHDDRRADLQGRAVKPLAEELGHGGGVQVLCHDPGAAPQDRPGQKGSDHSVPDADPGGGNAEAPAELTGIAHKDYRRKIGCTIGKGRQPRSH